MRICAAALSVVAMIVAVWGCSARKGANADPFEALSTEVDRRVTDASRAETMQAAIEKTEVAMNDLLQLATEQAEALAVVVGDYDSPREDFDRVFADYLEKRRPIVQRMLAAHLELKEEATPEEWERLAKKAHAVVDDVVRQNLRTSSDN